MRGALVASARKVGASPCERKSPGVERGRAAARRQGISGARSCPGTRRGVQRRCLRVRGHAARARHPHPQARGCRCVSGPSTAGGRAVAQLCRVRAELRERGNRVDESPPHVQPVRAHQPRRRVAQSPAPHARRLSTGTDGRPRQLDRQRQGPSDSCAPLRRALLRGVEIPHAE